MSLDVYLEEERVVNIFERNITHNLIDMAEVAGLYDALWRPEDINIEKADDLIPVLEKGLAKLKKDPNFYKKYSPENGWGSYEGLVNFIEDYLAACKNNPEAKVGVSR